MSAVQVKMTGEELERVWKNSGLTNDDIQPRLGISPASYYNYIKLDEVPLKVESRIDTDPELARIKNRELSKTDQDPPIKAGELVKFINDTFSMIRDQASTLTTAVNSLSDDNKLLRRLVESGLDSGALKWDKKG